MGKNSDKSLRITLWQQYTDCPDLLNNPCFCCPNLVSAFEFEIGHVLAESKGGEKTVQNCRPICRACNGQCGNKEMFEWMASLGYKRQYCLYSGCLSSASHGWYCQDHKDELRRTPDTDPTLTNWHRMRTSRDDKTSTLESYINIKDIQSLTSTLANTSIKSSSPTHSPLSSKPNVTVGKPRQKKQPRVNDEDDKPPQPRFAFSIPEPIFDDNNKPTTGGYRSLSTNDDTTGSHAKPTVSRRMMPLPSTPSPLFSLPSPSSSSSKLQLNTHRKYDIDDDSNDEESSDDSSSSSDYETTVKVVPKRKNQNQSKTTRKRLLQTAVTVNTNKVNDTCDNGNVNVNVNSYYYQIVNDVVKHMSTYKYVKLTYTVQCNDIKKDYTIRVTTDDDVLNIVCSLFDKNVIKPWLGNIHHFMVGSVMYDSKQDIIDLTMCSIDEFDIMDRGNRQFVIKDRRLFIVPNEQELRFLISLSQQGFDDGKMFDVSILRQDGVTINEHMVESYYKQLNFGPDIDKRTVFFTKNANDNIMYIADSKDVLPKDKYVLFFYYTGRQYYCIDQSSKILSLIYNRVKSLDSHDETKSTGKSTDKLKAKESNELMHDTLTGKKLQKYRTPLCAGVTLFMLPPENN